MERFLDTFSTLLHPNNYVMITGNNNTTYGSSILQHFVRIITSTVEETRKPEKKLMKK
jgi:hypothetical protein